MTWRFKLLSHKFACACERSGIWKKEKGEMEYSEERKWGDREGEWNVSLYNY